MRRGLVGLSEATLGHAPAALFDAASTSRRGVTSLEQLGFEVVARPGEPLADVAQPGDLFVRRALGEGRLALASTVSEGSGTRRALAARGIACEGEGEGSFVLLVADPGGRSLARRVSEPDGRVRADTMLLRARAPRMRPSEGREQAVSAADEERAFILDTTRSALLRLPASESARFQGVAWDAGDFPGGTARGPNEALAEQLFAAMGRLRPERRANQGTHAVVRRDELDAAIEGYIAADLTAVAGQRGHRLLADAATSFVAMREAAAGEGVTLDIGASHRSFTRARQSAARAGNARAVASFSSHSLGLAIDLNMSHGTLRLREISTSPFQNLVDMYRSPVYKWMLLRGAAHGWYPYRYEPWHWEYNPPDYRTRFRAAVQARAARSAAAAATAAAPAAAPAAPEHGEQEPSADPVASVRARRASIAEVRSQGLTLGGAVGAGAAANAVADVRAVQQRLIALGHLAAAHAEAPAADATAPVAAARLPRTIAALRAFQAEVRFWVGRGLVRGAVTAGVVAPGDATAALLARVSRYEMTSGSTRIGFRDHVRSGYTEDPGGVSFVGIASPDAIPVTELVALGLSAVEAAALRFVSRHEGNFDAINTYDRARVSAGFIQFAGGRGLPPYFALLKQQRPAEFGRLLGAFGIDVEPATTGRPARITVLDATTGNVLRGDDAERAIRDDKRLTTAVILSGRDPAVQRVQIAAAISAYVRPALASVVSWGAQRAALRELVRSERGIAMLIDRAVQEGVSAGPRRFERVMAALHARRASASVADMAARESELLGLLEQDLASAAQLAGALGEARTALGRVEAAARADGASVAAVLARSELADVRSRLTTALTRVPSLLAVATTQRDAAASALRDAQQRLAFSPAPSDRAALAAQLTQALAALATASGVLANTVTFSRRITAIARSELAGPRGIAAAEGSYDPPSATLQA